MRIAYIAPYQGPTLLGRRPIVRNRSMSNRVKIELIAKLLHANSHEVDVISQGEVVENSCSFYPSFSEPDFFHPEIPIYYSSVLPIRRLNGLWSNARTLAAFKKRHRSKPYDVVIVFNLKGPQIVCANYAIHRLGLPVILEYEDDRFSRVNGQSVDSLRGRLYTRGATRLLRNVSGCIGVSPFLLSQLPGHIPTLLLRGVLGYDLLEACCNPGIEKKNVVLFSGTHVESNGVSELIEAWRHVKLRDWELHITGYGELTDSLKQTAQQVRGVVFHGLVERPTVLQLMSGAKICINPHVASHRPGNVFAFKLIEYLAAGAHVITTRMGHLEKDLEHGITYMTDNAPLTIAATIEQVVMETRYLRTAQAAAQQMYGPETISKSLELLLNQVKHLSTGNSNVETVASQP